MHTEESPLERTPDLIAKIRALREQAEKEMNRFTDTGDYDVRRVIGRKPKSETFELPPSTPARKRQARKTVQASIDFAPAPVKLHVDGGDEA